jgi:predicted small lipoprotein YifL
MSLRAVLALCALAALSACGQKGPLLRPDEPPAAVPANPTNGQTSDESRKKSADRQR